VADDSQDEAGIRCPWCRNEIPEGERFCRGCGGLLVRDQPPAIFAATRTRHRNAYLFRCLGILVCVLTIVMFLWLPVYSANAAGNEHTLLATCAAFILFCLAANAFLVYWVIRLRHGAMCPACGERIPLVAFRADALAFCTHCGTRILAGSGWCSRRMKEERQQSGTSCGICGQALRPDDGYCAACGGNVGDPSDPDRHALLRVPPALIGGDSILRGCLIVSAGLVGMLLVGILASLLMRLEQARNFAQSVVLFFAAEAWGVVCLAVGMAFLHQFRRASERKRAFCPGCTREIERLTGDRFQPRYCPACGIGMKGVRAGRKPKRATGA